MFTERRVPRAVGGLHVLEFRAGHDLQVDVAPEVVLFADYLDHPNHFLGLSWSRCRPRRN